MSAEIELPRHPLFLCHRIRSVADSCSHCHKMLIGPAYACKVDDCNFLLHKECAESMFNINYPYHSDHPLTLLKEDDGTPSHYAACCEKIVGFSFSCKLCAFYLHDKCSTHASTQKHYLHEHELLYLDEAPSLKCNRCDRSIDSPLFRCVLCNFNLHEECMELPQVVESAIHWHPLTLRKIYLEDDSGEYYCDHCEERRDGQLGVYVCEGCSAAWAYHIECVLPELRKVFEKKNQRLTAAQLADQIAGKKKMVLSRERKVVKMKQELDEMGETMVKKNEEMRSTEESIEKMNQEVYDLIEQLAKQNLEVENELGKVTNAED